MPRGLQNKSNREFAIILESLENRRLYSTATLTQLAPSTSSSVMGQTVTLTATVTPQGAGTPTGMVRFLDNGVPIHVAETPFDTIGVDTEEDLQRVSRLLTQRT